MADIDPTGIELDALAADHAIPGAAVGVLHRGEIRVAATGVLNLSTRVPATIDSLFQIGSITKLWTATLIMQLAENALLELDAPVTRYIPHFRVGGVAGMAAKPITVRHLLTHTAGICDDFTPTTRGDDAIERYVADVLPTIPTTFGPGEGFQYSNPGYVALGRIAEMICGKPYPVLLRERIATPLGLTQWAAVPEDALLFGTAVGHIPTGPDGTSQPATVWSMSAAHAPAGSQVAMTAASLLTFAAAFLRGGPPLVAATTTEEMFTPIPELPEMGGAGGRLAIGGVIQEAGEHLVVAYDGATYGQSASLRIVPGAHVAAVSLANGGDMFSFHQTVTSQLVDNAVGIELPTPPVPPENPKPVDAGYVTGRYRGHDLEVEISALGDGRATVIERPLTDELTAILPGEHTSDYVRLDHSKLISIQPANGIHHVITLTGDPDRPAPGIKHYGRPLARI